MTEDNKPKSSARAVLGVLAALGGPMPWMDNPGYKPPKRKQSAKHAEDAKRAAEEKRQAKAEKIRKLKEAQDGS